MNCGSCKTQGPEITVAHVRGCYGLGQTTTTLERPNLADKPRELLREMIAREERERNRLRNRRDGRPATRPDHKVEAAPAGHYALVERGGEDADGEDVVKFYKIDRPTEGKWAGWTFLKIQAGDDYWPIKDKARKADVLARIAADPREASTRYGREIGACGVCHRTLTNPDSIRNGIGPICDQKTIW